jgi:uncharacterized protein (TIGR04255 family)
LSTQAYIRWEGFRDDHLKEAFKRLIEIYSPAFFQRIGLRYRNVIIRSKLGLDDVPWYELLQPHIAGEMGDENISKEILEAKRHLVINLGVEVGKVRVQHFLATVTQESAKEQCYVVDADYYYDAKTEPDDAITRLNSLNKYAGRLFRWCIRDRLYEAMGPQAVE